MTFIEVIILSIIQGLTEWLPISSSGHLAFIQKILGLNLPLFFDVMLHLGTLLVILIVFQKDISIIIKAILKGNFQSDEGKFGLFLIVGSIPIAVIGILFNNIINSFFSNLLVVGIALVITGSIVFLSEKGTGVKKMGFPDSFLIGLIQAFALIPGISRSGVTVSMGLLRRMNKETAFKYSFLLAIPAILGATIFESRNFIIGTVDPIFLILGVIISMIVGYGSLKFLKKIVIMEKFHLFAYYCWIFGLVIIFFEIFQ